MTESNGHSGGRQENVSRVDPIVSVPRPVTLTWIFLVAFVIHAPLLLMKLPLKSYDTNFHIFFASHYVHHWFDPWNPKWYAGFSQTTYPPSASAMVGADFPCHRIGHGIHAGAVRRHSSFGARSISVRHVMGGSPRRCAGRGGQRFSGIRIFSGLFRRTVVDDFCRAAISEFSALLYEWVRRGSWRSFFKGVALSAAAAAAHHATLLFGSLLFALPVLGSCGARS